MSQSPPPAAAILYFIALINLAVAILFLAWAGRAKTHEQHEGRNSMASALMVSSVIWAMIALVVMSW